MATIVGNTIFASDNYYWFFNTKQRNDWKRCPKCGYFLEKKYVNEEIFLKKIKFDISTTFDLYNIVTEKFRQVYEVEKFTGLDFITIPRNPGLFVIKAIPTLKVDITSSEIGFFDQCSICGKYKTSGFSKLYIKDDSTFSELGFYRTDLEFGVYHPIIDGNITWHGLIVGIEATEIIKKYKLKGFEFKKVYSQKPLLGFNKADKKVTNEILYPTSNKSKEEKMSTTIIGYEVYGQDAETYFFTKEQRQSLERCPRCGYLKNINYLNKDFQVELKKFDFSSTRDLFDIVSNRFREVYEKEGLEGLEFFDLPKSPGFYVINAIKSIKVDSTKFIFGEKCPVCGECESVATGNNPFIIENEAELLALSFYKTDIEFAGYDSTVNANTKNATLLAGYTAAQIMKAYKLRGLFLEPIKGRQVAVLHKSENKTINPKLKANISITKDLVSKDKIIELINENGFGDSSKISLLLSQSIQLNIKPGAEEEIPLGESKLGGSPDLPPGFEWPTWRKGRILSFIGQINPKDLAKYDAAKDLPPSGILYFFYDVEEETWGIEKGDKDSWRVIYFDGDLGTLIRTEAPAALDQDFVYDGAGLEFREEYSLPAVDSRQIQELDLKVDRLKKYEELWHRVDELYKNDECKHKLLGYPDPVQEEAMEDECQALAGGKKEDWRLLLQIDSGDATGMNWGDEGRLYFWIREQDLKARKFENVWLRLQCF